MSSSPPSSTPVEEDNSSISRPKSKPSSPDRAIAFLVHSPDSVANNLPPDCDNKPLARQRRRRTSPDDQRVLEEAFARNPRPSKDERQDIIAKVALGDKEVQIWFQNRRQTSRRKAKPLDTQDVDAHLSLRSSSPPPSSPIQRHVEVEKTRGVETETEKEGEIETTQITEVAEKQSLEKSGNADEPQVSDIEGQAEDKNATQDKKDDTKEESQVTALTTSTTSSQEPPASTFPTDLDSSQGPPSSSQDALFTSLTRPTYLANRRSASFVRQHAEEQLVASQPPTQDQRVPTLKKSGSYLRLSMTEDGVARVIDRSAPSPPRSQPVSTSPTTDHHQTAIGLRRSYSAAGLSDLFKQSAPETNARTKVPRVSQAGRSRDSRAWEFWCDSEARNALATKAEQENSGSAADAIGLIRQSSRNALRPNSRKANSPMVGLGSFSNHAASGGKPAKTKLQRASTTYGRLQGPDAKKGAPEDRQLSPSGDSDKENWDPDDVDTENGQTGAAPPRHHRRPLTGATNPRRGRTMLGENTQLPSYATSLGGLMDSEKKQRRQGIAAGRGGSPGAAVDAEVQAFMGVGVGGGDEDLDCVASLLSLSKGNWR